MPARHVPARQESAETPKQSGGESIDSEAARAAFALGLRQAIRTARGCWRICDRRVCKRARKCCASQVFCETFDLQRLVRPDTHKKT